MKIYSEITKNLYDTEKECLEAEKEFKREKDTAELSKKAAAKAIEDAQTKLDEANALYDAAKEKAAKMLEESNKEITKLLNDAESVVKKAEDEKLNAVLEFNKKYGTYKTTLTGEKAAEAYKRSLDRFNRTLSNFLDFIF